MRRDRRARRALTPILAALIVLASAATAQAATITLTTNQDPTGAGNCLSGDTSCSLRQAIAAENATPNGGDTIVLSSLVYYLSQGTDLDITKSVTLQGAGVQSTIIDGSENSGTNAYGELARILRVDSPATVTVLNLTFSHGLDEEDENCSDGCETINANGGGALFNNGGTVTLDNVAFTNDAGSGNPLGGAISNRSGTLMMDDVSFTGDSAGAGGALFTRYPSTTIGNGVTFQNDGTTCCEGGAAYLLGGTVTLTNTTIVSSGGYDDGGAIANGGATLTLDNVTMSDNGKDIQTDPYATTNVFNTILGSGCVPPGRQDELNGETTDTAITGQESENIAPDTSCNLSGTGDQSSVDPHLVPIFDNGGDTLTEAIVAGSPALGDPSSTNCPTIDQRGDARPSGKCDIGAFEAQLVGPPTTPTTGSAQNVTDSSADLGATINLRGEAGGFHFVYGTSSDPATWTASPEAAAGVVSQDTPVTETLSNLSPGTTYYYAAVADNASDSIQASNPEQFTTGAAPPQISEVGWTATDTTATVSFTIDPEGADTTYYVKYGTDTNYGQQSASSTIPGTAGPQDVNVPLSNLTPGTQYHFDVFASSSGAPTGVDSGDQTLTTDQQVTGTAGAPVTATDSGSTYDCPNAPTVTWGDGSQDTSAQVTCTPGQDDETDYTVTDTHTYDAAGHYLIQFDYGEGGETNQYAQISPVTPPSSPGSSSPQSSGTPQPATSKPTAQTGAPSSVTVSGAGFSGTVNPGGLATTAFFQYGLDSRYTTAGTSGPTYTSSTPSQSVGADSSDHTVGPVPVSNLLPNAEYHVRLVANNSAGTVYGPDVTFTTPAKPEPGAPTLGSFNASVVKGIVLIKINGVFVPLTQTLQIPNGAVIDALAGSLNLVTSSGQPGKTQHGVFGGAIFKLTQQRAGESKGLVTLAIVENAFRGAPSYALCTKHGAGDARAASLSSKTLQLLHASAHGKFRTSGRYSAATVRGTIWWVSDRCDGTLTHDVTDSVSVVDFVRHKTIILHAGQSYLAHKPGSHG